MEQTKGISWLQLLLGIAFLSAGIFQLGYIIGQASFSDAFTIAEITWLQVGIICTGIFGFSLFIANLKKLKMVQELPNK